MISIFDLSRRVMRAHASELRDENADAAAMVARYMSERGLTGDSIDATGPAQSRIDRVVACVRARRSP